MESFGGLPTHVLAVHAPVVLMPLVLVLSILFSAKPGWRRRTGPLLAGATAIVFVASGLAVLSGQAFDEVVGENADTTRHENLAITTLILVGLLLLATIVLFGLDRAHMARTASSESDGDANASSLSKLSTGCVIAVLMLAAAATGWMVMTGDEGARLVWDGVVSIIMPLSAS